TVQDMGNWGMLWTT
nr:immunoglobulin heavy chain junction region [Mus musculus]